jgi:hypothetical protein
MNKSIKIGLLISVFTLFLVNAGFFMYSSKLLDGLTSQLDLEEPSAEELIKVTETANTADKSDVHAGKDASSKKTEAHAKDADKHGEHVNKNSHSNSELAGEDRKEHQESEESEEEVGVIKDKYRPKLIGQCKNLYAKYIKKGDFTGNHRAFTYSFDGDKGFCAIVSEQKSKAVAEKEALKACEKSKSEGKNYAPCFVIASF